MNEQLINELIEQLTQSLKNVESANVQVKKVADSYECLENVIAGYNIDLGFIVQNARTMIKLLEEIKEQFRTNVSSEIIKKVEEEAKSLSNDFVTVGGALTVQGETLNAMLERILADMTKNATTIGSHINEVNDNVKTLQSDVTSFKNTFNTENTTVKNNISRVNSGLTAASADIKSEITANTESLISKANVNLIFIIINMILALIVLCKLL